MEWSFCCDDDNNDADDDDSDDDDEDDDDDDDDDDEDATSGTSIRRVPVTLRTPAAAALLTVSITNRDSLTFYPTLPLMGTSLYRSC